MIKVLKSPGLPAPVEIFEESGVSSGTNLIVVSWYIHPTQFLVKNSGQKI